MVSKNVAYIAPGPKISMVLHHILTPLKKDTVDDKKEHAQYQIQVAFSKNTF